MPQSQELQSQAVEIQILASFRKTRSFIIHRIAKINQSYRTHPQRVRSSENTGESAT